jgi:hypothetical protein
MASRSTLVQAIAAYGTDMQLNVAIEEFAELTKEICKHKRGEDNIQNIIEEVADCYIMLEQIKIIFGLDHAVIDDAVDKKARRLEDRLARERKEDEKNGTI